MKNLERVLSVVLLIAVIVLFVLFFTNKNGNSTESISKGMSQNEGVVAGNLRIAYVNIDSVIVNYQLAIDLNNQLVSTREQYSQEYSKKKSQLESEANEFQLKLKNGGFFSQKRAEDERNRLLGVGNDVQKLDYELTQKLNAMQQSNSTRIADSIKSFLDEYNQKAKYTYIINSNALLSGEDGYNLTSEVLNELNKRYKK